jgi:hypothetical protein
VGSQLCRMLLTWVFYSSSEHVQAITCLVLSDRQTEHQKDSIFTDQQHIDFVLYCSIILNKGSGLVYFDLLTFTTSKGSLMNKRIIIAIKMVINNIKNSSMPLIVSLGFDIVLPQISISYLVNPLHCSFYLLHTHTLRFGNGWCHFKGRIIVLFGSFI